MGTDGKSFKVLFLTKNDNEFAGRAAAFIKENFAEVLVFQGGRKDKLPDKVLNWEGDLLISFISSWIIPEALLSRAKYAAINFHPGSPEYPGIGCTNFAFYNGEKEYGVTEHHMKALVDTGSIIEVRRFPIEEHDTVYSVTQHCYSLLEEMLHELVAIIVKRDALPVSTEQWKRKPYTRKQLDDLCEIRPDMNEEEIARRIKATTYKYPWAFVKIGSRVFKLQS